MARELRLGSHGIEGFGLVWQSSYGLALQGSAVKARAALHGSAVQSRSSESWYVSPGEFWNGEFWQSSLRLARNCRAVTASSGLLSFGSYGRASLWIVWARQYRHGQNVRDYLGAVRQSRHG